MKPIITEPDAAAKSISVSVISPGADNNTLTCTSFLGSCSNDPSIASTLPWTSAFNIKFNSLSSPSLAWLEIDDKLTLLDAIC